MSKNHSEKLMYGINAKGVEIASDLKKVTWLLKISNSHNTARSIPQKYTTTTSTVYTIRKILFVNKSSLDSVPCSQCQAGPKAPYADSPPLGASKKRSRRPPAAEATKPGLLRTDLS